MLFLEEMKNIKWYTCVVRRQEKRVGLNSWMWWLHILRLKRPIQKAIVILLDPII